MNFKKKSLILGISLIISIQVLLFINNKQTTSFKYFIWSIQNVSIGKLISISFISGLIMSSIINKSLGVNIKSDLINKEQYNTNFDDNNSVNIDEEIRVDEIPPERDLRDIQPTISVNYRVIKDSNEKDLKKKGMTSKAQQYIDDWNNNDSEW